MTSENESEMIGEDKPLIIAESTEINAKIDDEPTVTPAQTKRVGRKKREDSAVTNELDTQPLFEQPVIVEGKRSRKPTSRLEITEVSPPRKELSIAQGHGKPLGEIPYVNHQLTHLPIDDLTHLRSLCFGRRASKTNWRKNLQDFNGLTFTRDSEEFQRHLNTLTKLKKEQIEQINEILGLDASSDATQILEYLLDPKDLGKAIVERPVRKAPEPVVVKHVDKEIDEVEDEAEEDEEEEEEAAGESDEDYLGSDDDDEDERTNHDDPEDFAYQPGKKAPKKKSKNSTTTKRKRTTTTRTKRSSKKRKISPRTKKVEAKVEEKIDEPAAPTTTTTTETNETPKADEEN